MLGNSEDTSILYSDVIYKSTFKLRRTLLENKNKFGCLYVIQEVDNIMETPCKFRIDFKKLLKIKKKRQLKINKTLVYFLKLRLFIF